MAFACVAGEGGGALEFGAGLGEASKFEKKVAADAGQEVVGLERGLRGERVDEFEARCRAEGHGDCYGTIELDNRRGRDFGEIGVERDDARPVRFL